MRYDVIVIGGGAAGVEAAEEAMRCGQRTLLVDPLEDRPARSGTVSCAALRAEALRLVSGSPAAAEGPYRAQNSGILRSLLRQARRKESLAVLESALRLVRNGIAIERGTASLVAPGRVVVGGRGTREAGSIIIATGSVPRRPERFSFGDGVVCDSDLLFQGATAPRSLVVIGGEEEGCELASIFGAFGVEVTLVERRLRLVRFVDRDLLEVLYERLRAVGVVIAVGEEVEDLEIDARSHEPHATLRLSSGRRERCDRVLVLAGRDPNTAAVGLDALGIDHDSRGFISVDDVGRTSVEGVYAVGDVTGPPFRVGAAVCRAQIAARHAAGAVGTEPTEMSLAIYGIPEVGVVGIGEDACTVLDVPCVSGTAWTEEPGFGSSQLPDSARVKLVFNRESRVLIGAQIVGSAACDLIHLGAALLRSGTTFDEIAATPFNIPSRSNAFREAALNARDRMLGRAAPRGAAPMQLSLHSDGWTENGWAHPFPKKPPSR